MPQELPDALWQSFEDVMSRFYRMLHARFLNDYNNYGLTGSQVFVLRYLSTCSHAKASDIAKVSSLSPGAVTQVCDELVKLQLVERARSSDDRRVVYVSITEAGRDKLQAVKKQRIARAQAVLERLGREDLEEFVRIVNRIVEILDEEGN